MKSQPRRRSDTPRRTFLTGSLAGLTLPMLLEARAGAAEAGRAKKSTAVIQVWLAGGPSQFETYDPKPHAPAEYRGPFSTIDTNLPGVAISETLPRQARVMDKVAILRSVHHSDNDHQHGLHWCLTGHYPESNPTLRSSNPSTGSITSRLRGANRPGMPPYVRIGYTADGEGRAFRELPYRAAYLGPGDDPMEVLKDRHSASYRVDNLDLLAAMTAERWQDRRSLLRGFDRFRRRAEASIAMGALDHFQQQAVEMLTTGRAQAAFDLEAEDARLRDRYGRNWSGQTLLLARRLVEAGVTFVTVLENGFGPVSGTFGWDMHRTIANGMNKAAPGFDQAVTTLIEDLGERGLDRDVLVLVWGEFGRTPRVNAQAGRDHWGSLQSVLVAGGGLQMGQVIGCSTAKGEVPRDRPMWIYDVLATLYHHLGIDPTQTFPNHAGRPVTILPQGSVISELV